MLEYTWLIPALPLLGFVVLTFAGRRLPRGLVSFVGVASVVGAAAAALAVGGAYALEVPEGGGFEQTLWTWFHVGDFAPAIGLRVDGLSVVMAAVVTVVGALIHLYAAEYMAGERGLARFFASMNLFVASMLVLVLADDLLFLYLGWEGVGLCSYLLIGFWYEDPENGRAARKAFVVTRVGDAAMAVALFWLVASFGTLEIEAILEAVSGQWTPGGTAVTAVAGLLLAGAVGKSAQLPLQVWLPDAMAGPTPVSALIHAATMVTAGVYLIARTHTIFSLAPVVQGAVAVLGALTLIVAGFSALAQRDIKRVLAYSTISQLGYMFLALGVGAWSAAVFHLMTHAFFKALLFLGAGALIGACGTHDVYRMAGNELREKLPTTHWTFLAASLSLAGVPLVTAGFYSKDAILWQVWSAAASGAGGISAVSGAAATWLWVAGLVGVALTAAYIFRVYFLVFGPRTPSVRPASSGSSASRAGSGESAGPSWKMRWPMAVLGALSILGGLVETPATLGGIDLFSGLLETAVPSSMAEHAPSAELMLQGGAAVVVLVGIGVAYLLWGRGARGIEGLMRQNGAESIRRFWDGGWGFDAVYHHVVERPYVAVARLFRRDPLDRAWNAVVWVVWSAHELASETQNGKLRLYLGAVVVGAVVFLGAVVLV